MRKVTILFLLTILLHAGAMAQRPARFNNEEADTARLTGWLLELEGSGERDAQALVAAAGRLALGIPYKGGTLEGEPEVLSVDTEHVDCTTFVEQSLALAITIESRRSSWHDYLYNLERLRYRGGRVDGYASRLHYISDWIIDNSHRGILQEVTDRIGRADYAVKTIDYMTTHREAYPALQDAGNFEGVKNVEIGYRSHRYPYIKSANLKSAQIKEGDVIAIVSNVKGLDVSHVGIAVMEDGEVHLMHASTKAGKVIVDPLPLHEYLRKNRKAIGIRVIRLKE